MILWDALYFTSILLSSCHGAVVYSSGEILSTENCSISECENVDLNSGLIVVVPVFPRNDSYFTTIDFGSTLSVEWIKTWSPDRLMEVVLSVTGSSKTETTISVPLDDFDDFITSFSFAVQNETLIIDLKPAVHPQFIVLVEGLVALEVDAQSLDLANVTVDFSNLTTGSTTLFYKDRCSDDYFVNTTTNQCGMCPEGTWSSGLSSTCGDVTYCHLIPSACIGINYCPHQIVQNPVFGEQVWNGTTLTDNATLSIPCDFVHEYDAEEEEGDPERSITRVCRGNQSWSEPNTTECLHTVSSHDLEVLLHSIAYEDQDVITASSKLSRLINSGTTTNLGPYDILMVYDIIDALLVASDGQYDVFSNIINAMSYLAKTRLCIGNPACYWYKTLLEDYVFSLKNSSTLLMGDIVGVFWTQSVSKVDIYPFCQGTFHDAINGCENDEKKFLKITDKTFLEPLSNSYRLINVSLMFFQGEAYFPTSYTVSPNQFNDTVYAESSESSDDPNGTTAVASMVVSVGMVGMEDTVSTTLYFRMNSKLVIRTKPYNWCVGIALGGYVAKPYINRNQYFNRDETTYQIVYHCATYQANNSVNHFLQGSNDTDFVSTANKLPVGTSDNLGVWSIEGCTTKYDSSSSDPIVHCDCSSASQSFAVIAVIEKKFFPSYYKAVLWCMFSVCVLTLVVGVLIIATPPKVMGIPKTAKVNIACVLVLILISFLFLIVKMIHELPNFYF
eukprot:sb/3462473/